MGDNFTPGHWLVMAHDDLSLMVCAKWMQGEQDILAHVESCNLADARLIAAAPELLEALEKCLEELMSYVHDQYDGVMSADEFEALGKPYRAVIAKAKGEA